MIWIALTSGGVMTVGAVCLALMRRPVRVEQLGCVSHQWIAAHSQ